MSYSLRPHEPQHTRPPCPSATPGVHPNPCPLSHWVSDAIQPTHPLFSPSPPAAKLKLQLTKWRKFSVDNFEILKFHQGPVLETICIFVDFTFSHPTRFSQRRMGKKSCAPGKVRRKVAILKYMMNIQFFLPKPSLKWTTLSEPSIMGY